MNCGLCINSLAIDARIIILGTTFIRGFYIIHDYETMSLTISTLTDCTYDCGAVKVDPVIGSIPSHNYKDGLY